MSEQVIKLSQNAAERIKDIMSKAEDNTIGVRVGVQSGGCAGMSYIMEYAKDIKPNEEVIVDGDDVAGHGPGEHGGPTMIAGSNAVFVGGIAVCNAGDLATCGDPATGSADVFVGD